MSNWLNLVHPAEGEWRAYLDGELPSPRHQYLERHLCGCARCRLRFADVQRTASLAAARLGALRAMAEVAPAPPMPAHFRPGPEHRFKPKEESRMSQFRITGRVAATAAAVLLASSLFIPGVRAAATEWVTVFRVNEARAVHINPADFKPGNQINLDGIKAEQLAKLVQIETIQKPAIENERTLEQVEEHGFHAPAYLPEGYTGKHGMMGGPGESLVQLDVDGINELLGLAGAKATLPAELKGQVIRISTGPLTGMMYTQGENYVMVTQTSSPSISASGSVDVNKIMQLLTSSLAGDLGLPSSLAAQLGSIDLSRTLPLPIMAGQGTEVKVKGHTGAFYGNPDGPVALVWVAEGQVHAINGRLSRTELLRIAESVGD